MHTMHNMQEMHDPQVQTAPVGGTLLTTKDVQALINVDRSTIYRMAEDGRLPAVKVGRQWRFPAERIHAWLSGGEVPAAASAPDVRRPAVAGDALQTLADLVGRAVGAMVIITDMQGEPLTDVANPCGMFAAVQSRPETLERCVEGWRELGDQPDLVPAFSPSHLGFLCARGFVRQGAELTGMVIVGGIAPPEWPPPPDQIASVSEELGLQAEQLEAHIDEVYHLDETEKDRILELLPRVGVLISQMSANAASASDHAEALGALAGRQSQRREQ